MSATPLPWYRTPLLWFAAAIALLTLGACVATIVIAARYADEPLPVAGAQVLRVPVARTPPAPPASQAAP
ncbi:MAG: hypothetical protein ABFC67_07725 [Mizugakiibacter sp.]|uniref:hypothetical protein n=1 Tax=Mizugakiibacter sp. TaxID=1972610 RepID=UPI0031C3B9A5|nr:hypothetical protein [Xanthomonadaceae bacterium]